MDDFRLCVGGLWGVITFLCFVIFIVALLSGDIQVLRGALGIGLLAGATTLAIALGAER